MFDLILLICFVLILVHIKFKYEDKVLWVSLDFKRIINKIKELAAKL